MPGWSDRDAASVTWMLDGDERERRERDIRRALGELAAPLKAGVPRWLAAMGWTDDLTVLARSCAVTPPLEPDEIMARRARLVADLDTAMGKALPRTIRACVSIVAGNEPEWTKLAPATAAEAIEAEARNLDSARKRLAG